MIQLQRIVFLSLAYVFLQMKSFICLFNAQFYSCNIDLLSIYCVSGTILDAREITTGETKFPVLMSYPRVQGNSLPMLFSSFLWYCFPEDILPILWQWGIRSWHGMSEETKGWWPPSKETEKSYEWIYLHWAPSPSLTNISRPREKDHLGHFQAQPIFSCQCKKS